jgi:cytochrome b involved in lipid metabolism
MATEGSASRVFIPDEIARHNSRADCWVAVFGQVLDVTSIIAGLDDAHAALADPLLDHAGKDISHWFDAETRDVRTRVDPSTEEEVPYIPMGRFPHITTGGKPLSGDPEAPDTPWWRNDSLVVGAITSKVQQAWIVNTLSESRHKLAFGCEETLSQVRDRFLDFNAHAKSYTWKVLVPSAIEGGDAVFRTLDMGRTLQDNGIADTEEEVEDLGLEVEDFLPVIHLYFNDDLTEA